jgi:hypothetical protein
VEAPGKNSLRLPFGSLFLLFRDPVIEKNWPQQGKRIWSFGFGNGQRCFLIKDRYKGLFEAVSQKIPASFSSQKLLDRVSLCTRLSFGRSAGGYRFAGRSEETWCIPNHREQRFEGSEERIMGEEGRGFR